MDLLGSIMDSMNRPQSSSSKSNTCKLKHMLIKQEPNDSSETLLPIKQEPASSFEELFLKIKNVSNSSKTSKLKNVPIKQEPNDSSKTLLTKQEPASSFDKLFPKIQNISNSSGNKPSKNQTHCDSVQKPSYKCTLCGKIYTVRSKFLQHKNNHKRNKKSGCHPFKKPEIMDTAKNVLKITTPLKKEIFECKICDKVFTKKKTYINHKYNHNLREREKISKNNNSNIT